MPFAMRQMTRRLMEHLSNENIQSRADRIYCGFPLVLPPIKVVGHDALNLMRHGGTL
jgi:hypothetical protein